MNRDMLYTSYRRGSHVRSRRIFTNAKVISSLVAHEALHIRFDCPRASKSQTRLYFSLPRPAIPDRLRPYGEEHEERLEASLAWLYFRPLECFDSYGCCTSRPNPCVFPRRSLTSAFPIFLRENGCGTASLRDTSVEVCQSSVCT